jgi:hypothetical protein
MTVTAVRTSHLTSNKSFIIRNMKLLQEMADSVPQQCHMLTIIYTSVYTVPPCILLFTDLPTLSFIRLHVSNFRIHRLAPYFNRTAILHIQQTLANPDYLGGERLD